MGWICTLIAAALFFLEGVGVMWLPKQMVWGLFFLAVAMAIGFERPVWASRAR